MRASLPNFYLFLQKRIKTSVGWLMKKTCVGNFSSEKLLFGRHSAKRQFIIQFYVRILIVILFSSCSAPTAFWIRFLLLYKESSALFETVITGNAYVLRIQSYLNVYIYASTMPSFAKFICQKNLTHSPIINAILCIMRVAENYLN